MPAPTAAERREVRFTIAADVLTEDLQSHTKKAGKVENISRSGCYIRSNDPWIMWTRIRVWVVYKCQQFEAEGSVVHAAGARGMGVSFEKITPPNLELLDTWLVSLPSIVQPR